MTVSKRLLAGEYGLVHYVDPWGRYITGLADLLPLMPEWIDLDRFNWRDDLVLKLKDPGDVGAQVWHVDIWDAGYEAGVSVHIPLVFSLEQTLYVVQTDAPVQVDPAGGFMVQAVPMVVDAPGGRMANADVFDLVFEVARADYLATLQQKALRKYPPISLALLQEAELDLESVVFVAGRKLRGKRFGATVLRARPMLDLDMIDLTFLMGDDEGRLFLSELPHRVETLRQAYSSLCPLSRAEQNVAVRQGEWWFVPAAEEDIGQHGRPEGHYFRSSGVRAKPLSKAQQREKAARPRALRGAGHDYSTTYGGRLALLIPGSEHFATEVVRDDEGWVWARGVVRHRGHDHAPLELEDWHLVLHNGQMRSWSTARFPL